MVPTGIFPDKLMIAKIIPLYKRDEETLSANYRLILLLPAISKIFEKMIFKQLHIFFIRKRNYFIIHNMVLELSTLLNSLS